MRIIFSALALLSALSFNPHQARAWNDDGHKVVALIADHYLLPEARQKIMKLLANDPDKSTRPDIASAATWADKYLVSDQPSHEHFDHTNGWHFIELRAGRPNIPDACFRQPMLPQGTLASQGPAKACIIDKINQFAAELADTKTADGERVIALKFLLNLVGDIHQPLRIADEGNRHGAGLMVTASSMTPGDLFTFWDSTLISRLQQGATVDQTAHMLITRVSDANAQQWASRAPQLWALETYQLGVDRAYGMIRTYDDQGRAALQEDEIDQAMQTVALQLSRAGVRLAHVLNESLSPSVSASVPARMNGAGDPAAGRQFATGACSVCHAVTPGQKMENMAPDFQAIAQTNGISEDALRDFLFGPHPSMPNIRLTQKQANNLIAYIMSLRAGK